LCACLCRIPSHIGLPLPLHVLSEGRCLLLRQPGKKLIELFLRV
jgi:hypothetical protein